MKLVGRWTLAAVSLLGMGFVPGVTTAQVDKYVEIAASRRQTPVYYEAFAIPGKADKPVVVVAYKIPNDRLVFMRHHEGNPGEDFRAGLDVTIEIFQGRKLIDSKLLKDEAFATDYESTIDPLKGVSGAVTFQLEPGTYGFRLQVTDQNTDRSAASLVRPLEVPDYSAGAVGKAIIAANVQDESDLFQAVELANLGGDAHFGKPAYAIVPFTIDSARSEPEIRWTLRRLDDLKVREERRKMMEHVRRRAREADEDETGIRIEQDPMTDIEGGVAIDSGIVLPDQVVKLMASAPVDILPDKVRLVEAKEAPDYYAAILNLHGERRENGAYALDIRLEGSDRPEAHRTTRFDTHWPDMPYSLYDIDVALQNMEFIVDRDQLKELRKGSREEKIAKFEAFWSQRDPTPETAYNELMVEYFKRVDYAALEYRTGAGFMPNGLKTDRAKIYIIHGPPEDITRSFPDRGGVLETWTYDGGRTFTFEAISSLDAFHLVDGS